MIPYYACLLCVTVAACLAQRPGQNRQIARLWIFVAFAAMVSVAGMRGSSVGTDTGGYTRGYEANTYLALSDIWEKAAEPGYLILSIAAQRVSDDYWVILTVVAVVVVFCYLWAIYKVSINPAISLFVFITMGYYTFFFNGARQGLAAAIYCLAFGSLIAGRFWRYTLFVVVAFLFHRTVILALPLYFVFRRKCSLWYVGGIIVGATIVVCFLHVFLSLGVFISERYSVYAEMEATGGRGLTLFYVLLCIFFLMFRRSVAAPDRRTYDCFLNMLIFGATIYVVVVLSGGYVELTRFAFYFQIASAFLWPIVFKSVRTASARSLSSSQGMSARLSPRREGLAHPAVEPGVPISVETAGAKAYLQAIPVLLGHLAYFYLFLSQIGNLVPYRFNEQVIR